MKPIKVFLAYEFEWYHPKLLVTRVKVSSWVDLSKKCVTFIDRVMRRTSTKPVSLQRPELLLFPLMTILI